MTSKESNKNQIPPDLIVHNESTARTLDSQMAEGRKMGVHKAQTDNQHAGRRFYQPQPLAASGGSCGEDTGTSGYVHKCPL